MGALFGLLGGSAGGAVAGVGDAVAPWSKPGFERNLGQAEADTRYLICGLDYPARLVDDGLALRLGRGPQTREVRIVLGRPDSVDADGRLPLTTDFYLGAGAADWVLGVPNFAALRWNDAGAGVTTHLLIDRGRPRFDLEVAPGRDAEALRLPVRGADALIETEAGVDVVAGGHRLTLSAPRLFQRCADGTEREIPGRLIVADGALAVRLESPRAAIDPALPLVVDPVVDYVRFQSSAFRTPPDDFGHTIRAPGKADHSFDVETSHNGDRVAVAGSIGWPQLDLGNGQSASFVNCRRGELPTTDPTETLTVLGACVESSGVDLTDYRAAFLAVYDANGAARRLAVIASGLGDDVATGVRRSAGTGGWMLVGHTRARGFPTLVDGPSGNRGSAPDADGRPSTDGFVMSFDRDLALQWSALVGGSGYDAFHELDNRNEAPIAVGESDSPTLGNDVRGLGGRDGLVAKFDGLGNVMTLALVGGAGNDRLDSVTRVLGSTTFAAVGQTDSEALTGGNTARSFQTRAGGGRDGLMVLLSHLGNPLASGYLGAAGDQRLMAVATTADGDLIMGGETVAPRTFDATGPSGGTGGVGGFRLPGETVSVDPDDLAVRVIPERPDPGGGPILDRDTLTGGLAGSIRDLARFAFLPISDDAIQGTFGGGSRDGLVARVSGDLRTLEYLSYVGGDGDDRVTSVAVDANGEWHLGGDTRSRDLPVTTDALQAAPRGGDEGFVAHLSADGAAWRHVSYFGTGGSDQIHALAVDADGMVYVAGTTLGCDFGQGRNGDGACPAPDDRTADGFHARIVPDALIRANLSVTLAHVSHPGRRANFEEVVEIEAAIRNLGPQPARDAQLEITVPDGFLLLQVTDPVQACAPLTDAPNTARCVYPVLHDDVGHEIRLRLRPQQAGTHIVRAEVSTRETDPDANNDRATLSTVISEPLQLRFGHSEVTQAIQDLHILAPADAASTQDPSFISGSRESGSMPLVAGKPTFMRVELLGTRGGSPVELDPVRATLRAFRDGVELPGGPVVAINDGGRLRAPHRRGAQGEAEWLEFRLPASWSAAPNAQDGGAPESLRLEVTASATVGNRSVHPLRDAKVIHHVDFWRTPPMCLRTYRVRTHAGTPATRVLLDTDLGRRIVDRAESFLPTPEIRLFPSSHKIEELEACWDWDLTCWGPYELAGDPYWILDTLWAIDQTSDDPDQCDRLSARTHYVGMANPQGGFNGQSAPTSWQGDQLIFTLAGDIATADINNPFGGRTLAHELGHNYGRRHVNCASSPNAEGPDNPGRYIFNNCSFSASDDPTSFFGFDPVTRVALMPLSSALLAAGFRFGDLMSYANDRWVSSFTYGAILGELRRQYFRNSDFVRGIDEWGRTFEPRAMLPGPLFPRRIAANALTPGLFAPPTSTPPPSPSSGAAFTLPKSALSAGSAKALAGNAEPGGAGSAPMPMKAEKPLLPHAKAKRWLAVRGVVRKGRLQGLPKVVALLDRHMPAAKFARLVESDIASSGWWAEALDKHGKVLVRVPMQAAPVHDSHDHELNMLRGFVPMPDGFAEVRLMNGQRVAYREARRASELRIKLAPPKRVKDRLEIRWRFAPAADPSMPPITRVQYSADGGKRWRTVAEGLRFMDEGGVDIETGELPGSKGQARVRLVVSHGLNVSEIVSAPFSMPDHAPSLRVDSPDGAFTAGTPIELSATAYDVEDGYLEGDALRWTVNGKDSGTRGRHLLIGSLGAGTHRVEVEVRDAAGQRVREAIDLTVRARP